MADPFIGEIRIFGGNFPPKNWAFCNGQLLPIQQNTALFSVIGTTYGGDGKSTFALPDLRGRVPVHHGHGPGLTPRDLGEKGGEASVTLTQDQMPAHSHQVQCSSNAGTGSNPQGAVWAAVPEYKGQPAEPAYVNYTEDTSVSMSEEALASVGESLPHNNMQPYMAMNFIIALKGVFPPRG